MSFSSAMSRTRLWLSEKGLAMIEHTLQQHLLIELFNKDV